MTTVERVAEALRVDQRRRKELREEIAEHTRQNIREMIARQMSRGCFTSGSLGQRIASAYLRAEKYIIDQAIRVRRETLDRVPEVGDDPAAWDSLLADLEGAIDTVVGNLPDHIRHATGSTNLPPATRGFEADALRLKTHARRKIESVRGEYKR